MITVFWLASHDHPSTSWTHTSYAVCPQDLSWLIPTLVRALDLGRLAPGCSTAHTCSNYNPGLSVACSWDSHYPSPLQLQLQSAFQGDPSVTCPLESLWLESGPTIGQAGPLRLFQQLDPRNPHGLCPLQVQQPAKVVLAQHALSGPAVSHNHSGSSQLNKPAPEWLAPRTA